MTSDTWPDERLNELADTLRPLPEQVGRLTEAVERLTTETKSIHDDFRSMRDDMSQSQRQIAMIGWALAASLMTALVALVIALA
jgi:uncharacterized protein YoxC